MTEETEYNQLPINIQESDSELDVNSEQFMSDSVRRPQNGSSMRLVSFLRNLADSIEQNKILPRQLQNVGEFFMKYQYEEESIKDDEGTSVPFGSTGDFDIEEMIKFLIMGYYIYCHILKDAKEDTK